MSEENIFTPEEEENLSNWTKVTADDKFEKWNKLCQINNNMYTDMWNVCKLLVCKLLKVGSEFTYNNLKYKVTSTGIEEINEYDFCH